MTDQTTPADEITCEFVREILSYDPSTGEFTWRKQRGPRLPGDVAGWRGGDRYVQIGIKRKLHYGHRLAWLHFHGEWPKLQLDHINGDPTDNRMENLRECTNAQNCQNLGTRLDNTSGATGVVWDNARQKWRAQIREGGKVRGLGRFQTFDEAKVAHALAKKNAHSFQPTLRSN